MFFWLLLACLLNNSTLGVAQRLTESAYLVDDSNGKYGLRWEGVGAISGGGATSKLLVDYPKEIQDEILDFLFKPNYGLSLQMLKVEIGGDADSTEGSEPSHMHTKEKMDFSRGYEFWIMKEAKKRNPDILLYGLPWAFPGWLGDTQLPDRMPTHKIDQPLETAKYVLSWIRGAKTEHQLDIDYVGQWNEKDAGEEYDHILRDVIGSSEFGNTTTVLGRIRHYSGTTDIPDKNGCRQYQWNISDGSRWVDEEGSIFDGRSARCLARCLNRQYISQCYNAIFQWHLISSFYDYFLWPRCGVMVANRPWSNEYEITSPLWALAHTTQFNPIGWRYAAHNQGVHMLEHGGSMVTRISEDLNDFSIVLEKMQSESSSCARGSNPESKSSPETVVIVLEGSFLRAVESKKQLYVWRSDLTSGNEIGENPDDSNLFLRSGVLEVHSANGKSYVSLDLYPNQLVTITTLETGSKGDGRVKSRSKRTPFPIPFSQTFDDEVIGQAPKYWYDRFGAFEIQYNPYSGKRNAQDKVLRQVVPQWPLCWNDCSLGPTTYFGPMEFLSSMNIRISIEILLENHATFQFGPYGVDVDEKALIINTKTGKSTCAEIVNHVSFSLNEWHTLSFEMRTDSQSIYVNKKPVGKFQLAKANPWALKFRMSQYVFMAFNNLRIEELNQESSSSKFNYKVMEKL